MKQISNILIITLLILFFVNILEVEAQVASFYVLPSSGSYDAGQTFYVSVLINTEGTAINAAQATIYFPPDKLKVVGVSRVNSIFSLWTQEPIYSNSKGQISFGGGLPSPGYRGSSGEVITILFQGKGAGEAKVYFGGEAILANDPWGTNLFSSSYGGTYFIDMPEILPQEIPTRVPATPVVTSPTHPNSDKWYSRNSPKFQWDLVTSIIGVSTALNQKPIFDPGNISQGVFDSKTFEEIEDGVWYFHIKLQNNIGWGGISHYKIQIDTKPPHPFEITIDNEGDPTNPFPLLYFEAKDDLSGVSHYEIKIGKGEVFSLVEVQTNPFRLPYQSPGIHILEIKAVDGAGNKTLSTSEVKIESILTPDITVCQDTFISGEEILYIAGSTLPNTRVIVFFKENGELIKKWELLSDEEGNWSLKEMGLFKSGMYRISARAEDSRGAISHPSEECMVKVILKGISIGPWIISYKTVTLIAILLLLFGLIALIYLLRRIQRTKRLIERETKDLKVKFYKEYNELKEDIKKQLEALKEAESQRELTGPEKEMQARLLKDLLDVERVIREELRDIEEIK